MASDRTCAVCQRPITDDDPVEIIADFDRGQQRSVEYIHARPDCRRAYYGDEE